MDSVQQQLWQRLRSHPLLLENDTQGFVAKLAAEQGWSTAEAAAAIEEYRRYCFLAASGDSTVTPSVAVDQVWHLHLTYSRDYWNTYCPQVLGLSLHHAPSRGGTDQLRLYQQQYAETLAAYEEHFGTPPARWWPSTVRQFHRSARWRWIDQSRYWLLPRPRWPGWRIPLATGLLALCFPILALALPSNPLDWRGGPFLALYFSGAVAMVLLSVFLRRQMAHSSTPGYLGTPSVAEVAYMTGGTTRMADALVAEGLGNGALEFDSSGRKVRRVRDSAAAERSELHGMLGRALSPNDLIKRLAPMATQVAAELSRRGMVLSGDECWRLRATSALPLLGWVGFGITKIAVGVERDKPVAFLVILCVICTIIAVVLLLAKPRLTSAGRQQLAALRKRNARLARAPRVDHGELGLAVALGGTAVLSGTAYAAYHDVRTPSSSSSCSSDSSSSDGDGGGGGGACGGCGGD